jgi:hypothetical protein
MFNWSVAACKNVAEIFVHITDGKFEVIGATPNQLNEMRITLEIATWCGLVKANVDNPQEWFNRYKCIARAMGLTVSLFKPATAFDNVAEFDQWMATPIQETNFVNFIKEPSLTEYWTDQQLTLQDVERREGLTTNGSYPASRAEFRRSLYRIMHNEEDSFYNEQQAACIEADAVGAYKPLKR